MDIICPKCGEPYNFDVLHDETRYRIEVVGPDDQDYGNVFSRVAGEFRSAGCTALTGTNGDGFTCSPVQGPAGDRALMAQAAYEACGDDMAGAAAILEDFMS